MNIENLKILRKQKGKTQTDIAEILGISYQAYAHYEAGRRQPDPDTLQKLADYFGVSVDYLLGREVPQTESKPTIAFFDGAEELSDEGKADVQRYIEFIKMREKGKK